MHLNDPLRTSAEGIKKDYASKLQGRDLSHYYPLKRDGDPDEWDAMIRHQSRLQEEAEKQANETKKLQQMEYSNDLHNAHIKKEEEKNFEERRKMEERSEMNKKVDNY